mmetsp:Transcript_113431/g.196965  ORF Transcript_113431/g.196965 Transcript_113431/m.196965 type:complete len:84 (+) Transcript_113431:786-1037(+)
MPPGPAQEYLTTRVEWCGMLCPVIELSKIRSTPKLCLCATGVTIMITQQCRVLPPSKCTTNGVQQTKLTCTSFLCGPHASSFV